MRVYTAWCWWLDYLSLRRCKWHHRVIQGMRVRTESARLRKAYTTWSASSSFRRLRAHHCLSVVRGLSSRTVRSRQRYIVSRWKAHAHFVSFEEHPHTKSAPLEAQETREAHAHETLERHPANRRAAAASPLPSSSAPPTGRASAAVIQGCASRHRHQDSEGVVCMCFCIGVCVCVCVCACTRRRYVFVRICRALTLESSA